MESCHADSLISRESIASLGLSTKRANYGMSPQASVSRLSRVIMMRCWTLLSTALETNLPQPPLMDSPEYIMYSPVPAQPSCKVTKMRFPKSSSTLRETKSYRQVAIKRAGFGILTLALSSRFWTVTKMRFSLAPLTTRETQ